MTMGPLGHSDNADTNHEGVCKEKVPRVAPAGDSFVTAQLVQIRYPDIAGLVYSHTCSTIADIDWANY